MAIDFAKLTPPPVKAYYNVYQSLTTGQQRVGLLGVASRTYLEKIHGGPGWRRVCVLAVTEKPR